MQDEFHLTGMEIVTVPVTVLAGVGLQGFQMDAPTGKRIHFITWSPEIVNGVFGDIRSFGFNPTGIDRYDALLRNDGATDANAFIHMLVVDD